VFFREIVLISDPLMDRFTFEVAVKGGDCELSDFDYHR
jgi:hypothetical protein